MSTNPKLKTLGAAVALAVTAFAAGWASGGTAFATYFNTGLSTALNSVGQQLFGSAVFGVYQPSDPYLPSDPYRLDFGDNAQLPFALNVFNKAIPGEPCRSYLQVAIAPNGLPVVKYDSTVAQAIGFNPVFQAADLSTAHPTTSQCPAPACGIDDDSCNP